MAGYADEAMALLAAEKASEAARAFAAAGRNDPCPCGSGEKFKRCHGAVPPPTGTVGTQPQA